ncbi:hypothetical protein NDU88_003994 [Pleurodeles waltl]|uniref:Uncharacterized protein n=1 Tax=Pleurodeles waltl TaxID=8319 RepID=A0AAV7LHB0_PLEWA|nr:hypothetical protein NDU88_003994 [Pleurodeles waltl]
MVQLLTFLMFLSAVLSSTGVLVVDSAGIEGFVVGAVTDVDAIIGLTNGAIIDGVTVVNVLAIFMKTFLVNSAVVKRILEVIMDDEARGNDAISMGDITEEKVDVTVVAVTTNAVVDEEGVDGVVDKKLPQMYFLTIWSSMVGIFL